ncbi:MAG: DUF512 domain-containing protein [Lachnospiraceae bacterium]|nr:DUF512 domain-containing protein [Lachnospiraceae bacterium]
MKENHHMIKSAAPDSIAEELGIGAGDELLEISGQRIEDIFDYQYLCMEEYLEVLVKKPDGEEWLLEIEKEEHEDLGIVFENGLMDEYHSCHNKCIFCFIDQMPPGMRETLYFKDDDTRLSFLQGNYVTLTNLDDHDIERMIRYRLEPINISFQTMNPELRCKMLNNRFAGDALKKVDRLYEAGIAMNGQIVLCKGINDGEELRYSLDRLISYLPVLESVSVVPVGLSKYREGLYPLEPFTKEDACEVIDLIEEYQKKALASGELHFAHASDEWYILAERELPEEERYDGYLQLENGVGMLRLMINETREAISNFARMRIMRPSRNLSIATGILAYETICMLCREIMEAFPMIRITVYPIRNDFFGEMITVSGLITGQDLIAQLKGKPLGECLLLPENMFRSGEEVFLDDVTQTDVQNALQVPVDIVKSSGMNFVSRILDDQNL